MAFRDEFLEHLNHFTTAPFLFVGSGMSRRYLGTDDWNGLLARFAGILDVPYARYVASANGDLPRVASEIANEFFDIWWERPEFEESRNLFPAPISRESPLKTEIAQLMTDAIKQVPEAGSLATELEKLANAVIEGVVTTNYDPLMEKLFPEFTVFSGQDELLFSDPRNVGEIYKIHGSCTAPESLVLTGADYAEFHSRNPYLAAKLLAVFVEHPVIFLGYSLTDPDVRDILTSISAILTNKNIDKLQDRLIFVQWDPQVSRPTMVRSSITFDGLTLPIWSVVVSDFLDVFDPLAHARRRFPAKLLRQLKDQVYELAQTSEPKGTLYVTDLTADVDASQVDVVVGVGVWNRLAAEGLVGWTRADILFDVLENRVDVRDAEGMKTIAKKVLPTHVRARTHTPVYKYLRGAGYLLASGALLDASELNERVSTRAQLGLSSLQPSVGYFAERATRLATQHETFTALKNAEPVADVLLSAPSLPAKGIDLDELREYLLKHRAALQGTDVFRATQWVKCVCLYDFLKYHAVD